MIKLAQEIVWRIDLGRSIWRKWDGQCEVLVKSAVPCWIPIEDLRDFLNDMPGPPLTTTDVVQRLKAFEGEDNWECPKEELQAGCLALYEKEKAEAATSCEVIRTADEIAGALHTITAVSKEVDIVDPYFDLRPAKGNYLAPLASLFARLAAGLGQPKAIRIHFRDHDSRPSAEVLARDGSAQVRGLLPPGYALEFYAWSEIQGGADFHDRFVLTDLGGIMIGAGLSADGPTESAAFTL